MSSPVAADAPPLALASARLELSDGTRLPELDFSVEGRRIALLGAFGPLFGLFAGNVALYGGRAHVFETPASSAVASGVLGLALCDPPFPKTWTAERYLSESARLLGWPKRLADARARDLLNRYELAHLAGRALATLPVAERRALLIAHATLADPPVIACEAPLDRLPEEAAAYVDARIERALETRVGIVHFPSLPATGCERAWLDRADTLVVLAHDQIVACGPPARVLAPSARVLVTVTRHGEAFRAELERRGMTADPVGRLASLLPALVAQEGATLERFLVALPDALETRGVLEASRAAEAPLVELRPLDLLP